MAASNGTMRLQVEVTCPICMTLFTDPVILDCTHTFCRLCIVKYWSKSLSNTCPYCRARVQEGDLIPNWKLANVVKILKMLMKQEAGGQRVCEWHQERLGFFCKEDEVCICVVCKESKEHQGHNVVPVEEAALVFKHRINACLETLMDEKENTLTYKAAREREIKEVLVQTEIEKERTGFVFRQLHSFLEEQEKLLLAEIEETQEEIARSGDEEIAKLSRELSSLAGAIQELQEKSQQPEDELLPDICSILDRCEMDPFLEPVAFPLPLQWKTVDIFNIAPFLDGIMKQLKDNLVSGRQPQKANVTLDPDTAHHWLVLSEDCKSMRWRDENQPSSEIFGLQHVVLGCEGFTAGRHWWEVSVGAEKGWAVGVARESVRGKGHDHLILGVNVWAVGRQGDINCYFPSYLHLPLSPDNPVERIRVFLDYGGGQVFFYNADSAALLCDISGVSFFGEPLLPFFMVDVNASLTISP